MFHKGKSFHMTARRPFNRSITILEHRRDGLINA